MKIKATQSIKMEGHINSLNVVSAEGNVKKSLSFPNVVLDQGIQRIFEFDVFEKGDLAGLVFGTGNSPEDASQTGLDSPGSNGEIIPTGPSTFAFSDVDFVGDTHDTVENDMLLSFRSGEGTVAGTWSEMGIVDHNGLLITRALIKDETGTPTTITVLNNEYLEVSYTLRIIKYMPVQTGSLNVGGVTYNYTVSNNFFIYRYLRTENDFFIRPNEIAVSLLNNIADEFVLANVPFNSVVDRPFANYRFEGLYRGDDGINQIGNDVNNPNIFTFYGEMEAGPMTSERHLGALAAGKYQGYANRSATFYPLVMVCFNPPIPVPIDHKLEVSIETTTQLV